MTHRTATAILQAGVVAVALVVLPYKLFELDRYFVPKELVLHIAALLVAALLLVRRRPMNVDLADTLLGAFLLLSTISSLFATNHWLAQRALGVSVSSAIIFWAARRLSAEGGYRPLLAAAALATICATATGLAQAYGVDIDYFSYNRAPGGTFGNRNFVAHFAVIGLPALVFVAITARSSIGALLGGIGVAAVAALLVLSRSRGAWLGVLVSAACVALPLLASRKYWRGRGLGKRLARLAAATVAGVVIAIAVPNRLRWTSDSPYLESAKSMVDYQSGSGAGRIAQYVNSLRMTLADPLLGVGPGNWPVRYVHYAPSGDASIGNDGMTSNPWPSSDWAAFVSERGPVAALALLGVFGVLFLGACRRWSALPDSDAVLAKLVLVATLPAVLVVSAFDAVLLLAAPSFLAWLILGATSGVGREGGEVLPGRSAWVTGWAVALLIVAASIARSTAQVIAITTVGSGGSRSGWLTAASLDPGSYRINVHVAEQYLLRGRCGGAREYAQRASGLFPYASEPKRVLRACR